MQQRQVKLIFRIVGLIVLGSGSLALANQILQLVALPSTTRILVLTLSAIVGGVLGVLFTPAIALKPYLRLRRALHQSPSAVIFAAVIGLFVGLALGAIAAYPVSLLPRPLGQFLPIIVAAAFGYVGSALAIMRPDLLQGLLRPRGSGKETAAASQGTSDEVCKPVILLDTSVIIDGRIADICRTGFIQGELIVPLFVLNELQHVADSPDTLRRNRGRRGLEILRQLQEDSPVPVRLTDADVPTIREVDDKLIALAKDLGGAILTNDYNLNRVAELQSVTVLNVNELANAVKTVLLPGETFSIHVLQEGKEYNQGVGYLDDGTMVVVEDGVLYMAKTITVTVTKVLQTAAGRMIFAKPNPED